MMATSPDFGMAMRRSHSCGVVARVGLAERAELAERHDLRVLELAQAFHVEHDDLLQVRRALAHGQDLVELLLVLDEQELGLAVVDQIFDLRRRVGRIDAGGNAGGAQHGEVAEQPFLVVVGQDGDAIARLQPERNQPHADGAGVGAVLAPGIGLPDAAILLAHGDLVGARLDAMPEQGRHCAVAIDGDRLSVKSVHGSAPLL